LHSLRNDKLEEKLEPVAGFIGTNFFDFAGGIGQDRASRDDVAAVVASRHEPVGTIATKAARRGGAAAADNGGVGKALMGKVVFAKRTHLENYRKANIGGVKSEFRQAKTGIKTNPNEPIHRKATKLEPVVGFG
jgi:hypothetical protein